MSWFHSIVLPGDPQLEPQDHPIVDQPWGRARSKACRWQNSFWSCCYSRKCQVGAAFLQKGKPNEQEEYDNIDAWNLAPQAFERGTDTVMTYITRVLLEIVLGGDSDIDMMHDTRKTKTRTVWLWHLWSLSSPQHYTWMKILLQTTTLRMSLMLQNWHPSVG